MTTVKDRIVALNRAHPDWTAEAIAAAGGANYDYVNRVKRQLKLNFPHPLKKDSSMTEKEIRADERKRFADILDEVASQPTTDPERGAIFNEIARVLRIPHDDLVNMALLDICNEVRHGV